MILPAHKTLLHHLKHLGRQPIAVVVPAERSVKSQDIPDIITCTDHLSFRCHPTCILFTAEIPAAIYWFTVFAKHLMCFLTTVLHFSSLLFHAFI